MAKTRQALGDFGKRALTANLVPPPIAHSRQAEVVPAVAAPTPAPVTPGFIWVPAFTSPGRCRGKLGCKSRPAKNGLCAQCHHEKTVAGFFGERK